MTKPLHTLFDQLNSSNVKYILLTDFESDLISNDLDLFVHKDDKNQFEEILIKVGWYKRKEPTHHLNHFFYYSPDSHIYLDVKYSLSFANSNTRCCTYTNQQEALETSKLNQVNIKRPTGIHAIILYAAHLGYKERGKLEQKHKHYLQLYIDKYSAEVSNNSCQPVKDINNWLDNYDAANVDELQAIINPFFRHEHKQMVRSKRYLKYGYGIKVLFLGTDGSGKTTLIKAVNEKLNLKTNTLYLGMGEAGWTSNFTKSLYNYKFQSSISNKAFSLFKSFIVLPAEFCIRMLPVKLKSKYSVVLIDRFPGSVFTDKKAGKKTFYNTLLPKPDLVFFLHADPETLKQRKPEEVTVQRSIADTSKFRKVADIVSEGKYIGIDTSTLTIDEARDYIISEIYKHPKVYENLFTTNFN